MSSAKAINFLGGFGSYTMIKRTALTLVLLVVLLSLFQLSQDPHEPRPWHPHSPRPEGSVTIQEKYDELAEKVELLSTQLSKSLQDPLISSSSSTIPTNLTDAEASTLCDASAMRLFPARATRKVYDLFLAGTELDMLEIRLNELDAVVDYFVIVESTSTFTNKPKPLYLRENFSRFAKFADKIIYRVIDFSTLSADGVDTWTREHYQRNALFTQVFPGLLGPLAPQFGDVLLVSDLDEIPKPSAVRTLRNCEFPARTTLWSNFYYYSFQWHHKGGDLPKPQATFFQGLEATILPEDLRSGEMGLQMPNASWHCSSCFSTVGEMVKKIESFSHTEYDNPDYKDPEKVVQRVRLGKDLFDREGEGYERIERNYDLPAFLQEKLDVYPWLVDRDPLDANFVDFDAAGEHFAATGGEEQEGAERGGDTEANDRWAGGYVHAGASEEPDEEAEERLRANLEATEAAGV